MRDIAHVIPGWLKVLTLALVALLLVAAALILAAALRNRRLHALSARLLEEVGTLSMALLPVVPERVGDLSVSVAYRPAEGLAAGGDFYDAFALEGGRVGIIVGDVSGHGRESLGPATLVRHMVRSYLEAGLAPRAALRLAGKVLDEHEGDEDFATVVAAIHDPRAGTIAYACAGHPPPIVRGPGAHRPLTVAASPPLGIGKATGMRQTTVAVGEGTTFCFYTDGLFEARVGDRILGIPRMERLFSDQNGIPTAEQFVARVARETDAMPDDVAACVAHVETGAANGTVRVEELELGAADLNLTRARKFLRACGVDPEEAESTLEEARRAVVTRGGVVLRVRMAEARSGVDLLPIGAGTTLVPASAVTA